jgi:hypothetical protein
MMTDGDGESTKCPSVVVFCKSARPREKVFRSFVRRAVYRISCATTVLYVSSAGMMIGVLF